MFSLDPPKPDKTQDITITVLVDEDGWIDWDTVEGEDRSAEWFKQSWNDCGYSMIEGYDCLKDFEQGDPVHAGRTFTFVGRMVGEGSMSLYSDDYEEYFLAKSVTEGPRDREIVQARLDWNVKHRKLLGADLHRAMEEVKTLSDQINALDEEDTKLRAALDLTGATP